MFEDKTLIINLNDGFTDMLRDIITLINFSTKYLINFSIKDASCRLINDARTWSKYPVDNLFDLHKLNSNKFFIDYKLIEPNILDDNICDFYKNHIETSNDFVEHTNNELLFVDKLQNINEKYIYFKKKFWIYIKMHNYGQIKNLLNTVILPNEKILKEFNNNYLNIKYNCIHYRYEDDYKWWSAYKKRPFILPPLDELINYLEFKNKYKIYICTSCIETLYSKNLMYKQLHEYDNILYKKPNNLNFDENSFLDLFIAINSEEFYGFGRSGYTQLISVIKNKFNYYDKIEYFQKFSI